MEAGILCFKSLCGPDLDSQVSRDLLASTARKESEEGLARCVSGDFWDLGGEGIADVAHRKVRVVKAVAFKREDTEEEIERGFHRLDPSFAVGPHRRADEVAEFGGELPFFERALQA